MTKAIAPAQKPFINHVSDAFFQTRKGLDKCLKAGKNTLNVVEWGCRFSESSSSTGESIGRVAKELGYVRKVIKLVDIVDDFKGMGEIGSKEGADLGFQIAKTIGFTAADAIEIALFAEDVGIADLGQASKVLSYVGAACAGAALTTGLVESSMKHVDLADKIAEKKKEMPPSNGNKIEDPDSPSITTKLENEIAQLEFEHTKNTLGIINAVFDIAAIIFGFIVAGVEMAAVIAVPILAILGLASAVTGLIKLWIDNGDKPQPASDSILPAGLLPDDAYLGELEDEEDDGLSAQILNFKAGERLSTEATQIEDSSETHQ